MCTVLLPSGVNTTAVMSYHIFGVSIFRMKQSKGTGLLKPLSLELIKYNLFYLRAGKSLARPGRKQARSDIRRGARFQQHRDASCHQVSFPAKARCRKKYTPF